MKKSIKIVSVVLIIMTMLMVAYMPAFAAIPTDAVANIWITTEQTNDNPQIYKITMHLAANYPVSVGDYRVYWPNAEFKLIRNTGVANSTARPTNTFNYLGAFLDKEEYDDPNAPEEYIVGPGAATFAPTNSANDQYFNEAVPKSEYSAVQLAWITGSSDPHYFYDSNRWGDLVAEFYLQKLDGAPDDAINHVGPRADAPRYDVAFTLGPGNDGYTAVSYAQGNRSEYFELIFGAPTSEVTAPVLAQAKRQLKFTATSATTVADAFQFRVISKITGADWDAHFANTATSDTSKNALTELGFVAYKGTEGFSLDAAKAAAKAGETTGEYYVATTGYIQHTAGDYQFAATINFSSAHSDVTYIAYAKYNDADGAEQYLFYEAEKTALLKTDYENIVKGYLGANPYQG